MNGRILVTGSREWKNVPRLSVALLLAIRFIGYETRWGEVTIVHGGAIGADMLADRLAHEWLNCQVETHPYDTHRHGSGVQGPLKRNTWMVSLGADFCVAAYIKPPGTRKGGTRDCYEKAIRAGIPTFVVPHYEQVDYATVQEIQGC